MATESGLRRHKHLILLYAGVVELADTQDLKECEQWKYSLLFLPVPR